MVSEFWLEALELCYFCPIFVQTDKWTGWQVKTTCQGENDPAYEILGQNLPEKWGLRKEKFLPVQCTLMLTVFWCCPWNWCWCWVWWWWLAGDKRSLLRSCCMWVVCCCCCLPEPLSKSLFINPIIWAAAERITASCCLSTCYHQKSSCYQVC